MPGSSTLHGMVMWAGSFVVRYGFVAVALGLPAYLDLWPVVAMLGGFAGVYLAENAVLLSGVMRATSNARRGAEGSAGDGAERRVEA
jgi:hypothetical protein